jgi:hypothetical protein
MMMRRCIDDPRRGLLWQGMQSLDLHRPGMPDLQFVLLTLALCTSDLESLNVPPAVRRTIFDRCWRLLHESPPPERPEERVLDLRHGTEVTLEAMVEIIRSELFATGLTVVTWDHPVSPPSRSSSPEALPLVERLERLYPRAADDPGSDPTAS